MAMLRARCLPATYCTVLHDCFHFDSTPTLLSLFALTQEEELRRQREVGAQYEARVQAEVEKLQLQQRALAAKQSQAPAHAVWQTRIDVLPFPPPR